MSFSNDPIGDYLRVTKIKNAIRPPDMIPYTPLISERDRRNGEIVRYFGRFITHTDPSDIVEVSKTTYNLLTQNALYQTVKIRWKVSGRLEDEYGLPNGNTQIRLYTGPLTANRLSVEFADELLPGIASYITDYTRFWEP